MRWIFISLVVANLVVAGYFMSKSGPDAGAAVVVAERELPGVMPLQLLSEADEGAGLDRVPAGELPVVQKGEKVDVETVEAQKSELCSLVGPFSRLLRAEYFAERLSALDIDARVRQLQVPGEPSFTVVHPPLPSRKAALRRLNEFQLKGVDSYVIPSGEMENGISAGLFESREAAQAQFDRLISLGFEMELRQQPRSFEEIWVVIAPGEAAKADEELWMEMLTQEQSVELQQNFCPAVASE